MEKISILIADDHEIVCQGLHALLSCEAQFKIVGIVRDGEEAVSAVKQAKPDIVLMDMRMPKMNGVAACHVIKTISPETAVIILSAFDNDEEIYSSIEAGAAGYLLKDSTFAELIAAIKAVSKGQSYFHPLIAQKISGGLRKLLKGQKAIDERLSGLTEREIEVLKLLSQGYDNKTIGEKLFISESTVKTHVSHILRKLDKPNRVQAILYTKQLGSI